MSRTARAIASVRRRASIISALWRRAAGSTAPNALQELTHKIAEDKPQEVAQQFDEVSGQITGEEILRRSKSHDIVLMASLIMLVTEVVLWPTT